MYYSTKLIDGLSACFRQWKAKDSHCRFLHGYALSFKITFRCVELDDRNWCYDFGGFKKSVEKIDGFTIKDWFTYWFDHTTIIAFDDPVKLAFDLLKEEAAADVRVMPDVGCEKFAEFVYVNLREAIFKETYGRVAIQSVECIENNKNSAIYEPSKINHD